MDPDDLTRITDSLHDVGIDPATAEITDGRTWGGNGAITVTIRTPKPVRQAVYRPISGTFDKRVGEWSLKVGGRYVAGDDGWPVEFASAGQALASVLR